MLASYVHAVKQIPPRPERGFSANEVAPDHNNRYLCGNDHDRVADQYQRGGLVPARSDLPEGADGASRLRAATVQKAAGHAR